MCVCVCLKTGCLRGRDKEAFGTVNSTWLLAFEIFSVRNRYVYICVNLHVCTLVHRLYVCMYDVCILYIHTYMHACIHAYICTYLAATYLCMSAWHGTHDTRNAAAAVGLRVYLPSNEH